MSIFERISESLPLLVSHAVRTGDVLTLSGASWSLSTPSAWRLRDSARIRVACYDASAEEEVSRLVGRSIVRVEPQSADFPADPRLVLDDGQLLEIFSTDTFEPWTWRLPSPPVWVAAPGDEAWVKSIRRVELGGMDTAQDDEEAREIAKALLEHTGFAGFAFSTQFSLRFSRDRPGAFRGHALPAGVEVVLHGDWWLDELDDWRRKVARLAPAGAVEPEEPLQAYELALLRWTEGTTVASVELAGNSLRLRFQNGRVLTADGDEAEGPSWTIGIPGVDEPSASWRVAADGGALHVRAPRSPSS